MVGSISGRIMHVKVINAGLRRASMDKDSSPVASVQGSSQ
jgi:hypothetical protein